MLTTDRKSKVRAIEKVAFFKKAVGLIVLIVGLGSERVKMAQSSFQQFLSGSL